MNRIRYTKEPCPHCGNFTNRGMSVDIIIVKDNKILLGKRGVEPFKGFWGNFGGYVDWDETIEDVVQRELQEETGLTATKITFLGFRDNPKRHPFQVVTFSHAVEVEGEPKAADDIQELQWFDLDKLPTPLAFDHEEQIKAYLKENQSK